MLSRLRTLVIVTLFAVVLWVFAESESLGEFSGLVTIRFVTDEGQTRLVLPDEAFDGTVNVSLVGSKAAIGRCKAEVNRGIALEPGMAGVPAVDGRHTINLLEALQGYGPFTRAGARVASVSPQFVEVQVTELVTRRVQVEASLGVVETVGEVRLVPDQVEIRAPRGAFDSFGAAGRASAVLDESRATRLPVSGPAKEVLTVRVPAAFVGQPGLRVEPASISAEFTIRSRSATESLRTIPVQVVLPPIEVGKWAVEVNAEDRFLSAQVTASPETIDRLKSGAEAVIAVVALSSDELQSAVESKEATFLVLRAGALSAARDIEIAAERRTVRLTVTRSPPTAGVRP